MPRTPTAPPGKEEARDVTLHPGLDLREATSLTDADLVALDRLLTEFRDRILAITARPVLPPTLLSVERAAEALGISRRTLYNRIDDGTIGVVRLGRRVLVPITQIARVMGDGSARRDGR